MQYGINNQLEWQMSDFPGQWENESEDINSGGDTIFTVCQKGAQQSQNCERVNQIKTNPG